MSEPTIEEQRSFAFTFSQLSEGIHPVRMAADRAITDLFNIGCLHYTITLTTLEHPWNTTTYVAKGLRYLGPQDWTR